MHIVLACSGSVTPSRHLCKSCEHHTCRVQGVHRHARKLCKGEESRRAHAHSNTKLRACFIGNHYAELVVLSGAVRPRSKRHRLANEGELFRNLLPRAVNHPSLDVTIPSLLVGHPFQATAALRHYETGKLHWSITTQAGSAW